MSNQSLQTLVIGHIATISKEEAVLLYETIYAALQNNSSLKALRITVDHEIPQELIRFIEDRLVHNNQRLLNPTPDYIVNPGKSAFGLFPPSKQLSLEQQEMIKHIKQLMPDLDWIYQNGQISLGLKDKDSAENFVRTLNQVFTKCTIDIFAVPNHINGKITLNDVSLEKLQILVEKHSHHFVTVSDATFEAIHREEGGPKP